MRNKILLFGLIIVIMALIVVLGYTNARYSSTASMTGDFDYTQTIGEISAYQPVWIEGYTGGDDGSGVFDVPQVPLNYPNIHYKVTNKVNDAINENEAVYYIRIVAEDGSDNIPIAYDVHEYANIYNVLNLEEGVGYGPFTLGANSEETQYYSIRANYISTDSTHAASTQHLRVQIVKKRNDGKTLKVIDEAPLNMQYSGPKVITTFAYYLYGSTAPIGTSQTLGMEDNFTIDFKNSAQLNNLGITLPSNCIFHDVRHNINNAGEYSGTATSVTIPEGYCLSGHYIEVYVVSSIKIPIQIAYYNYLSIQLTPEGEKYIEISDTGQTLVADRASLKKIDFESETVRKNWGINLPTGYNFYVEEAEEKTHATITSRYVKENSQLYKSEFYSPNVEFVTTNVNNADVIYLDVLMISSETAKVNLSYYNSQINSSNLIGTKAISDVKVGTIINFIDSTSLSSLGITLPSGYEFKTAYCTGIDSTGAGHNEFKIPYNGGNKTYNINVVLEKVVTAISIPVKFYDSNGTEISSTTIDTNNDGTYTFTTGICRLLCPSQSTKTSFTIYIANQWGSTYELGNTYEKDNVTIDYNATYTSWAEFKLTDPGSYIYIKVWW